MRIISGIVMLTIALSVGCGDSPSTQPTATPAKAQPTIREAVGDQTTSPPTLTPNMVPTAASVQAVTPTPTIDPQVQAYMEERRTEATKAAAPVRAVAECTQQTEQYWLDYVSDKGRLPIFPADINECIKNQLEGDMQ